MRNDYVFPGDGKSGFLQEPKKGWRRILQRAELYYLVESVAKVRKWGRVQIEQARAKALEDEAGARAHYQSEAEKLKIATSKAALRDLRIHDLRRTLGSWQAATGASLVVIGKTLGHKDVSTTAIYARLDLDPVRQAMQNATGAILDAAGLRRPGNRIAKLPKRGAS
jgi:integrase